VAPRAAVELVEPTCCAVVASTVSTVDAVVASPSTDDEPARTVAVVGSGLPTVSAMPEPTNPTAATPAIVAKAVAAIHAEINPNFFMMSTVLPLMTRGRKRVVKKLISGLSTL